MGREAIKRRELSRWIIGHYEKIKNLMIWLGGALRAHRDDHVFTFCDFFPGATPEELELLQRMNFLLNGERVEKKIKKTEIQFLTGGWLEEYCFNEAFAFLGQGVDDVVIGVKIRNPKGADNEFDVMFTKDNALYTIECKSLDQQDDKKTDALYKIAALQKDFGLRVSSFLVSTSPHIMKNGKIRPSIAARAEHLNTWIVSQHEVLNFGKQLANKLKISK